MANNLAYSTTATIVTKKFLYYRPLATSAFRTVFEAVTLLVSLLVASHQRTNLVLSDVSGGSPSFVQNPFGKLTFVQKSFC